MNNKIKHGPYELADEEASKALKRSPTEKGWGLFMQAANPQPGIDEAGQFLWFDTKSDLFDFLKQHAVYWASMSSGATENDLPKICEAAAHLVQQAEKAEITLVEAMDELSDWLYEFNREFTWAGSYAELLTGEGEFPVEVRTWFRQVISDETIREAHPEDGYPLRKEELLDFLELLEEYRGASFEEEDDRIEDKS
jgi:hypothetical protein